MLRLANVPASERDPLIESAEPPTVEALAEPGTSSRFGQRAIECGGRNSFGFEFDHSEKDVLARVVSRPRELTFYLVKEWRARFFPARPKP